MRPISMLSVLSQIKESLLPSFFKNVFFDLLHALQTYRPRNSKWFLLREMEWSSSTRVSPHEQFDVSAMWTGICLGLLQGEQTGGCLVESQTVNSLFSASHLISHPFMSESERTVLTPHAGQQYTSPGFKAFLLVSQPIMSLKLLRYHV